VDGTQSLGMVIRWAVVEQNHLRSAHYTQFKEDAKVSAPGGAQSLESENLLNKARHLAEDASRIRKDNAQNFSRCGIVVNCRSKRRRVSKG